MNVKKGISIIEILVVLAILAIVLVISLSSLPQFNSRQALEQDANIVRSVIKEAQVLTISSKNDSTYGVHVSNDKVILFIYPYYSDSETNISTNLSSKVQISSISLNGGGSDIVFDRLNGATTNYGTIRLSLKSDSSASSTIEVYKSGLVEKK